MVGGIRGGPLAPPAICVVIVNYNGGDYLSRCIEGLRRQTFEDFEAIIVDNDSSDGSLEDLAALPASIRVLRARKNLGFAAANNRAARNTSAPWLATLNVDTYPDPDWLQRLMAATKRYPMATMFGSTLVDLHNSKRLDGCGDVYHAAGLVWRGHHRRPTNEIPEEGEVFGPCAAAALYRRDAFLAAGGFDERFFCYCEDIDLAFRMRLAGAMCVQVSSAVVRHVGSGLTGRRSAFAVYHGTRNRLWTFVKNMPGLLFWPLLPLHLLATLALLHLALARGTLRPAVRGLLDGLRGLGRVWIARQEIQAARCVSTWRIARALTWSPTTLLRRRSDVRPVAVAMTPGSLAPPHSEHRSS